MYYFFRGLFIYEQQMGTLHYTVQEKVKTVLGLLYTACMQSISKYKSIATQCLSTSLLYSDIQDNCLTIFPEMYKHKGYFVGKWLKTPYQQQSDDGHLFKRQYYYNMNSHLTARIHAFINFLLSFTASKIHKTEADRYTEKTIPKLHPQTSRMTKYVMSGTRSYLRKSLLETLVWIPLEASAWSFTPIEKKLCCSLVLISLL